MYHLEDITYSTTEQQGPLNLANSSHTTHLLAVLINLQIMNTSNYKILLHNNNIIYSVLIFRNFLKEKEKAHLVIVVIFFLKIQIS